MGRVCQWRSGEKPLASADWQTSPGRAVVLSQEHGNSSRVAAIPEAQASVLAMKNQWQPIETCPAGKPVLVYIPEVSREKNRIQTGWWNKSANGHPMWVFGGGARFGFDVGKATHWMELPEPPGGVQ